MSKEQFTLSAIIRPQRVAVVIPTDMPEEDFREVIKFLGLLWGGSYSCIVPADISTDNHQLALSWLKQYSPDHILYESKEIMKDLEEIFYNSIEQPFESSILEKPFENNIHYKSLMPWWTLIKTYIQEINSTPGTKTRFNFISTSEEASDRIFYDISLGVQSKKECEWLSKNLLAPCKHIEEGGISELLKLKSDKDNPFSYLDISNHKINRLNAFGNAPTVNVLSRAITDYAWFWNNRINHSPGGNNSVAIPIESIDEESTICAIATWLSGYHDGKSNYCNIKSISAPIDKLQRLARRLRPRVNKFGYKHVDVSLITNPTVPSATFFHSQQDIPGIQINHQSLQFSPPLPTFRNQIQDRNFDKWVVEIKGGNKLDGHIPPNVSQKTNTRVLSAPSPTNSSFQIFGYSRRYFKQNIALLCSTKTTQCAITLPTANELLKPFFSSIGIKEKIDEKRLCYDSVFNLFGGRDHFATCCKDARYKIISSLWSKKNLPCETNEISLSKGCRAKQADAPTPVKINKIKQQTKIGKDWNKPFTESLYSGLIKDPLVLGIAEARQTQAKDFFRQDTPKSYLSWLVDKTIVRRVFNLPRCPSCDSNSGWTSKMDLEVPLSCSRCGGHIPFPEAHTEISYQLNPLVYKAFKEGVRPVALTLSVLEFAVARDGFMFLPGFKGVRNGQDFDIDIIAVCNGELILCECKDMSEVPATNSDWIKVKKQFESLIELGELLKAKSVILSSLANKYPKMIRQLAKKKTTEEMRIVLLRRDDLLRGHAEIKNNEGEKRPATLNEFFLPNTKNIRKKLKGKRTTLLSWGKVESS